MGYVLLYCGRFILMYINVIINEVRVFELDEEFKYTRLVDNKK